MIITKAHETDVKHILELQRTAYQSEAEIYNDYSIQPLVQTLENAMEEFQNGIVLKAVVDNRIIGSVRASVKDDTAFIGKLMVLPEFQNRGIGRRLLLAIEDECRSKRCELFTGDKSEKNIALYKKCGYAIFKTEVITQGLTFVYMEKHPTRVREITPADLSPA